MSAPFPGRNGQKFRKPIRWLKASPAGANFYSLNRTKDPKGSCDRCSSRDPVGEISNLPRGDPPALTRRKILISTPTKSSPTGSKIHHLSHFGSGGSFNKKSPLAAFAPDQDFTSTTPPVFCYQEYDRKELRFTKEPLYTMFSKKSSAAETLDT